MPSNQRLASLDGLRALAITSVMLHHSPAIRNVYSGPKYGWIGVDLFFVLSGYLITQILLLAKGKPRYYKNFFARRALRIWPLYLVVISIVIFAIPAIAKPKFWPVEFSPVYYYFFLQNAFATKQFLPYLSPTWSLVIEEQFYLIWPFTIALLPVVWLRRLCIAGILLSPLIRLGMLAAGSTGPLNYAYTFTHMDGLLMGASIALFPTVVKHKWGRAMGMFATVTGAALFVAEAKRCSDVYASLFAFSGLALCFGGLLVLALRSEATGGLLAKGLGWKPLSFVGTISYGMYLLHEMAQWAAMKSPVHRLLNPLPTPLVRMYAGVILEIALTVAIASLSWILFESPVLELKRFLTEPDARSASA